MDHLDVVARAVLADVGGARHAADDGLAGRSTRQRLAGLCINLRGDSVPDGGKFLIRRGVTTGHERWTEASPFLAARHAGADKPKPFIFEGFFAADGVGPKCVTAVDDDVGGFEQQHEAVDDGVGRLARLHENNHFARLSQGGDELRERLGADHPTGRGRILGNEFIGFFYGPIKDRDLKAVICDIERQVLAHNS